MRSPDGLYTHPDMQSFEQKPATADVYDDLNTFYSEQWRWERSGLVAGAAFSMVAGFTGSVSAQEVPPPAAPPSPHFPSDSLVTQTASGVTDAMLLSVTPEASTSARFGSSTANTFSTITPVPDSIPTVENEPCQGAPCRGIKYIDAELPKVQKYVQNLRAQMQVFQSQHTAHNLEMHRAILANRAVEIGQQRVEVGKQLSDTELQLLELQTLLAMQPYEAGFAKDLLFQDARYQDRLQQLQEIDRQIAVEFSQPELNHNQLEALYTQYNQVAQQLYQDAQAVLSRFIAISQAQASNPLWQEPMYHELLQRLMTKTHQHQVLSQRSETINYIESLLQERRAELAKHLREYANLQQELTTQTQILQDYIIRRQALQAELSQPKFAPPPSVIEPELATVSATGLWHLFAHIPADWQQEVALALLMGAGILTALAQHQSYKPAQKDYQLPLPQTELIAPEIDLPADSQVSLVSVFEQYSEKDFEVFSAMAIAIVLQTFRPEDVEPPVLPVQLMSELSDLAREPVALPMDDIDLYADEAIKIALNGLDLDAIDEIDREILSPEEEITHIFGATEESAELIVV
jgi:hypothetical protein